MTDTPSYNGDFVRIGNREVYDKLVSIEKKVDKLSDLPNRVRSLELKFYGLLAGGGSLVGAAIFAATRGN